MFAKVKQWMSPTPIAVSHDLPLSECLDLMEQEGLQFLPVQYRGRLIGVLRYSEVKSLLCHLSGRGLTGRDLMVGQPFVVSPDADVMNVLSGMSEWCCEFAVVQQGSQIVGIFTFNDAVRLLGEILEYRPAQVA
jgi:predicted transcriptional regulator